MSLACAPNRHSGIPDQVRGGIQALLKTLDPGLKHAGVTLGLTF